MRDLASDSGAGLVSFRRYTWWSLTGATAVLLVFLVGRWILDGEVPAWARASGAVSLTVTVVASVQLFTRRLAHPDRPPLAWMIIGGAAAATLGGILLSFRVYGLWSFAPAMMVSIIATFLPLRPRRALIAVTAVGAAALGGIVSGAAGDGPLRAVVLSLGMVALIAWATLGMLWAWDVAGRLNEARRLAAELAVADERLRFAADLHDIQGHHLQVIALKSELAARLAQTDPTRAAEQMHEVRRLSVEALQDTRAVVKGYRRTALDAEIANATKVLAAAEIDARMRLDTAADTDRLPEAIRHLLGLVMREATTNVLRHSRARQAVVDYRVDAGLAKLRIWNDGAVAGPDVPAGSGLRMLAERLAAAGGRLTWERDGDRFVVVASLPLDAGAGAEAG